MIGLGAKYLTAAGFGRYRITAASLGSNLMFGSLWLNYAAQQTIMAAFGADGTAVIRATNEYLNGIAASDKAKATALAGFINEDPMMVCSLGLEPTLTTLPSMPIRFLQIRNNSTYGFNNGFLFGVQLNTIGTIKAQVLKVDTGGSWIFFSRWSGSDATNPCWGKDYNDMGANISPDPTPWNANTITKLTTTINRSDNVPTFWGSFVNNSWSRVFNTGYVELYDKQGNFIIGLFPTEKDGKAYMMDMATQELHGNVRNNKSFQIVYNLADGTPWTPPTP